MKISILAVPFACIITIGSLVGCQKNNEGELPIDAVEVNLNAKKDIKAGTIKIHAECTTKDINEIGVCWSEKNAAPTVTDAHITHTDFYDKSEFTANIRDLNPDRVYFFRAFITYQNKKLYSDVVSINTQGLPYLSLKTKTDLLNPLSK